LAVCNTLPVASAALALVAAYSAPLEPNEPTVYRQAFAGAAEVAYMLALPVVALALVAYTLLWAQAAQEPVAAQPAEPKQ
jgi:hypothetical protein